MNNRLEVEIEIPQFSELSDIIVSDFFSRYGLDTVITILDQMIVVEFSKVDDLDASWFFKIFTQFLEVNQYAVVKNVKVVSEYNKK